MLNVVHRSRRRAGVQQSSGPTSASARSYYGSRAKLGLILPSMNSTLDPELARICPAGVSWHTTRLLLLGQATPESFDAMAAHAPRAAEELAAAEVDVVAYCCASGSAGGVGSGVVATIERICGVPAFTAMDAAVRALRTLGVRRIALVTPYIPAVNELERAYLHDQGFEVVAMAGMDLGHTQAERRAISHQPPARTRQLAHSTDVPEAQAVFLSCANLATLEIVDLLERELGKPVVTTNQAILWAALRTAGVRDSLSGWGRLPREY
jgi:maleate cis-trans isomerase